MSPHARTDAYDHFAPLLAEYADLDPSDPARRRLRDEIVAGFRPVVRNIAARFARRGEPVDDLEQVAALGLLNALERFDPARGRDFLSYAIPTMMGEVRRHFRDVAWTVRTPRGIKDGHRAANLATTSLEQALGRSPTRHEVAEHMGVSRQQVDEAQAASRAYRPDSLDRALMATSDTAVLDLIGTTDTALDAVDTQATVGRLLATLPEREQKMLVLRFVHEQTQYEIAAELKISQMHVSRLLTKTLGVLRERAQAWGLAAETALAA